MEKFYGRQTPVSVINRSGQDKIANGFQRYRKSPIFGYLKYCCVHAIGSNSREISIHPNDAGGMANSEDPDPKEQSDLGLHCVSGPVCRKTVISVGCDDPIIYE